MRFAPGPGKCLFVCVPPGGYGLEDPSDDVHDAPMQDETEEPSHVPRAAPASSPQTPVLTLPAGKVQGVRTDKVDKYLGLPFAAAPVEDLRWAAAKELTPWSGVFDASKFGAGCPQQMGYNLGRDSCRGFTRGVCAGFSEDCLSLNVFVPRTNGIKAVMVWIHGGCFVSGSSSSSSYDGSTLAAAQDVVIVTVNYRLGAFGFLAHDALRSRDPGGSTGNYGLLDNIAALKWIQKNIGAFGGDPSRVTIFGESSGAGSVSQLLGLEAAWPYFHQGIMESGAGSFWTYMNMDAAYHLFDQVVQASDCDSALANSSIQEQVSCLTKAPASKISSAVRSVYCRDSCTWTPVVDGVAVRGRTTQLARTGKLRPDTPTIGGYNLNDGGSFVGRPYTMNKDSLAGYFAQRFGPNYASELEHIYPIPSTSPSWQASTAFMAASNCETDWSYACTAQWLAESAPGPAYVYEFSQPQWNGLVLHGDEIKYVFGHVSNTSSADANVSHMMMSFWANFARSGNPNGPGLPPWPLWSAEGQSRALLNISQNASVAYDPQAAGCGFFLEHWDYYKICLPDNPSFPSVTYPPDDVLVV
eukprot:gnl/TRDRNA2_/TRDRNA2_139688_c0_seq1.p1 gnl/TRDRNA2_/TRDRNA2_139688_c0~~gnl/TRDRNA2_/TRDRNA2_139688_c0_seq1.p1  ORF type:complete len:609 (-),score=81.15 gnl/TRDRNA2_/TRDRNA2_139688_c0_seq1:101-1849(-)